MTIRLPEELEHYIREQVADGQFASADDVLSEAVRLLRDQRESRPAPEAPNAIADRATRQRECLSKLCQKMDSMPSAEVADGLTNRDHDRILYGR